MPEITVTETQHETVEEIRSDLEAAYIEGYGHIRTTDVVQYLLDTYTHPDEQAGDVAYERIATAEFPLLQRVAAEVDEVPGSGIDTETMRGELVSTLGVEAFAARLAELDDEDEGVATAADGDDGSTDAPADDTETADGDGDESDDANGTDESPGSTPDTDGPGAILSAANKLLTDHEDKWRKGGGEEPYEVDLPDGSTEDVRTKDDVKQLLFKHY